MLGGILVGAELPDRAGQRLEARRVADEQVGVVERFFSRSDFGFDARDFVGQAVEVALVLVGELCAVPRRRPGSRSA